MRQTNAELKCSSMKLVFSTLGQQKTLFHPMSYKHSRLHGGVTCRGWWFAGLYLTHCRTTSGQRQFATIARRNRKSISSHYYLLLLWAWEYQSHRRPIAGLPGSQYSHRVTKSRMKKIYKNPHGNLFSRGGIQIVWTSLGELDANFTSVSLNR